MDEASLDRFVEAQEGVYEQALAELRAGAKRSHWMWFVFPQIAGLGLSGMSRRYAIRSLDEARDYLLHPVLGSRLQECAAALLAHPDRRAEAMLGPVDAAKLRSSMTLFERAADGIGDTAARDAFARCLDAFFGGGHDEATLRLIAESR